MKRKLSDKAFERLINDYNTLYSTSLDERAKKTVLKHLNLDNPLENIRQFTRCVFEGHIPPPNLLRHIAENFSSYLNSQTTDLDYAFRLSRKQKTGQPVKDRKRQQEIGELVHKMWELRKDANDSGGRLSIEKAAECVLINVNNPVTTVESLIKKYSECKIDEINQYLDELMKSELASSEGGKALFRAFFKNILDLSE